GTWAVVGLSGNPSRTAYAIAGLLQRRGKRIVPVHPSAPVVLGEQGYATLADIPFPVDVVDVFRRPEHVAAIVEDCIRLKAPALWLQDGVVDDAAAQKARDAGLFTVMNRCMFRDRSTLG
ncbi:MAG TPA: CoA-binding protein, partial [Steroidobacteraceae bacterium]